MEYGFGHGRSESWAEWPVHGPLFHFLRMDLGSGLRIVSSVELCLGLLVDSLGLTGPTMVG